MLPPLVLALFAATLPLSAAQVFLPSSAPQCARNCFQIKVVQAPYLAPNVNPSNLAGLCATPSWFEAYANCMRDNCVRDLISYPQVQHAHLHIFAA